MDDANQPFWKFKQIPVGTKGAISKWRAKCKKYDDYAELEFETVINTLSAIKNWQLWTQDPRLFKKMVGWEDIYELRFENAAGVPLRVFGFFREEEQEFVMVVGASKDQKKYDPPNSKDLCDNRKKEIELGLETPVEFSFDEEPEEDEDEYLKYLLQ